MSVELVPVRDLGEILTRSASTIDSAGRNEGVFAPHLWQARGNEEGRYARGGEAAVKSGIVYRIKQDTFGDGRDDSLTMNGERVVRYIGPDNHHRVQKVVVHFPGFAHTHHYEDAAWYVQLLAEYADKLGVAFVTINQVGNAVKGADLMPGRGRIGLKQRHKDNVTTIYHVLEDILVGQQRENMQVIISGHSLGARDAVLVAADLIEKKKTFKPAGLVLWASTGLQRGEDVRRWNYVKQLTPFVPKSTWSLLPGTKGVDFSLADINKLFYGNEADMHTLCFAATGLNAGPARAFYDLTLGAGVTREAKVAANFIRSTAGKLIVVPSTRDQLLDPKATAWQRIAGARIMPISAPHNALRPNASGEARRAVQSIWETVLA